MKRDMNPMFHVYKSIFPALTMALLLGACPTVNWDYPRTPSIAFVHPKTTSAGELFGEAADKHPGLSGFSLFNMPFAQLEKIVARKRACPRCRSGSSLSTAPPGGAADAASAGSTRTQSGSRIRLGLQAILTLSFSSSNAQSIGTCRNPTV